MFENTTIYLLNVPLDKDYQHTMFFPDKQEQFDYFIEHKVYEFTNYSYQRKDNKIRISGTPEDIGKCNYVMYQNAKPQYKWYYAFIKEVKFISDGVCDVIIETDVMQTWMFDIVVGQSFVEREHVDDDTRGLHTIPENLETGEYVCNGLEVDENLKDYAYVLQVSELFGSDSEGNPGFVPAYGTNFGGIPSTGGAYVFDNWTSMATIVQEYSNRGKADSIICAYMIPKKILNHPNYQNLQYGGLSNPITYLLDFGIQVSLNGYTPKNNKLLCYPYNYLAMSNNAGTSNILMYEHFKNDLGELSETCNFEVEGIPSIGGSIKCVPLQYKGVGRNQDEGIMGGKYPTLSWSEDLFTNWSTQNAVNNNLGIAGGVVSTIGGIALLASGGGTLAGAGMIVGGVGTIANKMAQIHTQSFTPNSAKGNVNSGDINTANKMNTFYFYKMSVKKEYARIIDNYFTMYGYKVNDLKVPNKNHRRYFWFTKTIDANIQANTTSTMIPPKDDLGKIVEIYNRGITFWSNRGVFRDYSVDNAII